MEKKQWRRKILDERRVANPKKKAKAKGAPAPKKEAKVHAVGKANAVEEGELGKAKISCTEARRVARCVAFSDLGCKNPLLFFLSVFKSRACCHVLLFFSKMALNSVCNDASKEMGAGTCDPGVVVHGDDI